MELQDSCYFWIKIIQQSWFKKEFKIINQDGHLPRSNSLTHLTPYIDQSGLRVGRRLENTNLSHNFKHPILLPRHSPLSTLIIVDAHLKTLHGGTQITLAYIRQNYWILGGRAPIRSYILRCIRCARYRGIRAEQLMGQLSFPRVNPSRLFLHTGVDYAGPIIIKTWHGRSTKTYKGYLVIFVCLSISAVHLEVVTDYTTEAFIATYKRFTGHRGICASLYSDCGTNFIGADSELRKRFESTSRELKELARLLANEGTKWHFNPPAAPHFGGKWEAAVKSVKYYLIRTIGDSILTYEELSTLLIQIEAILNSRPLSAMSEYSKDLSALTPGHFLISEPLTIIPEPSLINLPASKLSKWQLIQQKIEHFWNRWSKECLHRFQSISKWHHPSNEIKKGSLVLITDKRYPPSKWPLARVLELHPGTDGLIRVVTIKTATSVIKRSITKLCILPFES